MLDSMPAAVNLIESTPSIGSRALRCPHSICKPYEASFSKAGHHCSELIPYLSFESTFVELLLFEQFVSTRPGNTLCIG